jgi:hypothetical protein
MPMCFRYAKTGLCEKPTGSIIHHTTHAAKPETTVHASVFVSILWDLNGLLSRRDGSPKH